MAKNSKIAWTTHTFNPWRGCTKVSDGCKFCYAEDLSKRNPGTLGIWGKQGTRVIASEKAWNEVLKWNREAEAAGERHRVFCASLADVFEGEETMPADAWDTVQAARVRLFALIHETKNLDWLLLTKRPENVLPILRDLNLGNTHLHSEGNIWIGTSVENQEAADKRIPHLLKVPARVRFLSCEPLLDEVDLDLSELCPSCEGDGGGRNYGSMSLDDGAWDCRCCEGTGRIHYGYINWVIAGGESGPNARPFDVEWARSLKVQCDAAAIPFFMKQLGEETVIGGVTYPYNRSEIGDMTHFPDDLQVQHFPEVKP
jgi:protein gp37